MSRGISLLIGAALAWASVARADRYEATISVRPAGALARVDETGARAPATVAGGGGAVGLSWGVRNWLDLGGELAALALTEARYTDATKNVAGRAQRGDLSRTSRLAQLRGVATVRLGVGWVPTVQIALGVGARQRTAARLVSGSLDVIPDGEQAGLRPDVIVGLRLGLDHRLNRRWSIGVSAGATECLGLGAAAVQLFDAQLAIGYSWYPLW